MDNYLGIFIDDDEKNFEAIQRSLKNKEIELLPYEGLPDDIDLIFERIVKENVDFIIIDYDLSKQSVAYSGMDVLEKIREQDSEVYIIYLTNKDFVTEYIGDFDQAIKKKDFPKEIDNIVSRLKRALSRDLSIKNEREIQNTYNLQKAYFDKQLKMLEDSLQ